MTKISNLTSGEGKPVQELSARIFVPHGKQQDIVSEVGLVGDTRRGSTAHFNVFYHSTLGTDGATISDAILRRISLPYKAISVASLRQVFHLIFTSLLEVVVHLIQPAQTLIFPSVQAQQQELISHLCVPL